MQFSINKQTIIIGVILLASILAIIGIFALVDNKNISDQEETGGAGKPGSQQLIVDGWNIEDEFGNTVGAQLELLDQDFITSQILNDYQMDSKNEDLLISANILSPIKRVIEGSKNTLSFQMEVDSIKYSIHMNYDDRKITIKNLKTNREVANFA